MSQNNSFGNTVRDGRLTNGAIDQTLSVKKLVAQFANFSNGKASRGPRGQTGETGPPGPAGPSPPLDPLVAVSGVFGVDYALLSPPVNGIIIEGNVGIGTSSPTVQLDSQNNGNCVLQSTTFGTSGSANLTGRRALGTQSSPLPVDTATRILGTFQGQGYDGTAFGTGGSMTIRAEGTSAFSGTNHAGFLQFQTCPKSSITNTERMRIDSEGHVAINNTAPSQTSQFEVKSAFPFGIQVDGTSTTTVSDPLQGLNMQGGLRVTENLSANGSDLSSGVIVTPNVTLTGGQTIASAAGVFVNPTFTGNAGTITTMSGILYSGGLATPGGVVTNSYGAYLANPLTGTASSVALYADNAAVGVNNTTPPTNGLLVQGNILNNALTPSSWVQTDAKSQLITTTFVDSTYTPTQSSTSGSGIVTAFNSGSYIQIGNFVSFNFATQITSFGTAAGELQISLPVAQSGNPSFYNFVPNVSWNSGITFSLGYGVISVDPTIGGGLIRLIQCGSAVSASITLIGTNLIAPLNFTVSGTYQIA